MQHRALAEAQPVAARAVRSDSDRAQASLAARTGNRVPVVIMAGGLGSRLMPLTAKCPKPLLTIGPRPLLETTLQQLAEQSFHTVYLAVNYQAEMIEQHFGDGRSMGIDIHYIREQARLGTAGALSLLPSAVLESSQPIIALNGDILAQVDYSKLLASHLQSGAAATMATVEQQVKIPFGVVYADHNRFVRMEEKPAHAVCINAGIYVLNAQAIRSMPADRLLDMPELFRKLVGQGEFVATYPLPGYWLDIGTAANYERANRDFGTVFQ